MQKGLSISGLVKNIKELRDRDIPYLMKINVDILAHDVKDQVEDSEFKKLDIKKRQLLSPFRVKRATKTNLTSTAFIYRGGSSKTDWRYRVLKHHFFGGDRDRKGLEKALIRFGHMSDNEILTPPPGVSIKPSTYIKIISQLKVVYKSGYSANETKKSRFRNKSKKKERYFIVGTYVRSHLHPGIYARIPGHDKPISILRIVKTPKYDKKIKSLEDVSVKEHDSKRNKRLGSAIGRAIAQNRLKGWI